MKTLLYRLIILSIIAFIVYYLMPNNTTTKTTNENVVTTEIIEDTTTYSEVEPEVKKSEPKQISRIEKPSFLEINEVVTYSNGSIKYTVQFDSINEVKIIRYEPNKMAEGYTWLKGFYVLKNNSINTKFINTTYLVTKNELTITENGKKIKYILSEKHLVD